MKIRNAIIALAALLLMSQGLLAKPKKEIGLQLYSIREVIGSPEKYAQNHIEVFAKLASWGYTAVEAASWIKAKARSMESRRSSLRQTAKPLG